MQEIETRDRREPRRQADEMVAEFELRIGRLVAMRSSARMTPAGMISLGIAIATMTLAVSRLTARGRPNAKNRPD